MIIVSILLAFALQACWENRKNAETEQEMLIALESELQGAPGDLGRESIRLLEITELVEQELR